MNDHARFRDTVLFLICYGDRVLGAAFTVSGSICLVFDCKVCSDYANLPFVLNFPIKTVRTKTVPHSLQGVLTSRTAVKVINPKLMHTLISSKLHKKDIRLFTNLYSNYYKDFIVNVSYSFLKIVTTLSILSLIP